MGTIYTDLNSDFPDKVSTMTRVQDVSASMKPYVDEYYTYYNRGDFDRANGVITAHPELLNMIINAKIFNDLRDEIIATQRTFKDDVENYIYTVVKNRGDWNSSIRYAKYNVVFYTTGTSKNPYMAIADNIPIGTLPTDLNYWYPLSIKGEQGIPGLGLTPRGKWSEYVQYYQHDMVSYNNALWAASEDNIGYFPSDSSTVWYSVLSINIAYESIKITNEEIDKILIGTATLMDTNTGTVSNESISKEEIDNVLTN